MTEECKKLLAVHFGDIDGMFDPYLCDYFIDRNYWTEIVENCKFFVIGRKGTGKSALYQWIKAQAIEKGDLCSNMLFNEFPLGRLLQLKDDSFLRPNQYQTICKNMILSEMARLIVHDAEHELGSEYEEIEYYYNHVVGSSIQDCFRESVQRTTTKGGQLVYGGISIGKESSTENVYSFKEQNLSALNSILEKMILAYLKVYSHSKRFLIQVDGIDENYTLIAKEQNALDDYFQFVICLLKTTYVINQKIHSECCDTAKCIIYLRADIFNEIHKLDAESARWEQYTFSLNWAINSKDSWKDNDLRRLVNKRIRNSIEGLESVDAFDALFVNDEIHLTIPRFNPQKKKTTYTKVRDLFEHIVIRTFHRPRDIIQFCIKIQEEARKSGELTYKTFREAEKEYSLWFLSEIKNEITANVSDSDELFAMLRSLGGQPVSITTFKAKYAKYRGKIGLSAAVALKYLYELAVIYNINDKGEVFSSIRNYKSKLNPDIKICLHPGFWKGLYVSTF